MSSSLDTLTSAHDYVNFYYEKLKNEFNARGIQISKVGVIGFILHILGFYKVAMPKPQLQVLKRNELFQHF